MDPNLTLNVRPETIKLLEENTREKLHDVGLGSDFLNVTPKAQATKIKTDMEKLEPVYH